jgi:hypothetical protein
MSVTTRLSVVRVRTYSPASSISAFSKTLLLRDIVTMNNSRPVRCRGGKAISFQPDVYTWTTMAPQELADSIGEHREAIRYRNSGARPTDLPRWSHPTDCSSCVGGRARGVQRYLPVQGRTTHASWT